MWMPEASTHVFRGKSHSPYLCNRCRNYIGIGERYERRVYRIGRSRHAQRLMIEIEHVHDRDCPYEELEAMEAELWAESTVGVAVTIVMTSRLVAKVAFNGETIFIEEPCLEMRTENSADPLDCELDDGSNDSDDEIPF